MRIVAITIGYPPQRFIGSEVATHAMLRHLVARGHEVTVVIADRSTADPWEIDGIRVVPGVRRIHQFTAGADVVVTHADIGSRRFDTIRCPIVAITHNARPEMQSSVATDRWSLIVHNADATAEALTPSRRAPYIVVRPPVDWRDYVVDRPDADAITMVNVTREKGSELFYDLAALLPRHHFLGVVGGWGAPDVRKAVNVELVGHTDDMRTVYARTRILVMPSRHESWGRVAVEAMASGIPVIASDLPGPRECVADGGVFVDRDDVDGFAKAIRNLDRADRYATASKRAAARARALDPGPELDRFAECVEALAVGEVGPWVPVTTLSYRNLRDGRVVESPIGSAQQVRLGRLVKAWTLVEEVPA